MVSVADAQRIQIASVSRDRILTQDASTVGGIGFRRTGGAGDGKAAAACPGLFLGRRSNRSNFSFTRQSIRISHLNAVFDPLNGWVARRWRRSVGPIASTDVAQDSVAAGAALQGMKVFASRPYPMCVETTMREALRKILPHLTKGKAISSDVSEIMNVIANARPNT
jgi:hypothetical protein